MPKLTPQPQGCNNSIPHIAEQEVARASAALGVNAHRPAPNTGVRGVAPPRPQKEAANRDPRPQAFARKVAASAFKAARWGRS
jgi:hypothetical protein